MEQYLGVNTTSYLDIKRKIVETHINLDEMEDLAIETVEGHADNTDHLCMLAKENYKNIKSAMRLAAHMYTTTLQRQQFKKFREYNEYLMQCEEQTEKKQLFEYAKDKVKSLRSGAADKVNSFQFWELQPGMLIKDKNTGKFMLFLGLSDAHEVVFKHLDEPVKQELLKVSEFEQLTVVSAWHIVVLLDTGAGEVVDMLKLPRADNIPVPNL